MVRLAKSVYEDLTHSYRNTAAQRCILRLVHRQMRNTIGIFIWTDTPMELAQFVALAIHDKRLIFSKRRNLWVMGFLICLFTEFRKENGQRIPLAPFSFISYLSKAYQEIKQSESEA